MWAGTSFGTWQAKLQRLPVRRDWFWHVNWGNNEYNDGFFLWQLGGFNLLAGTSATPEVQNAITSVDVSTLISAAMLDFSGRQRVLSRVQARPAMGPTLNSNKGLKGHNQRPNIRPTMLPAGLSAIARFLGQPEFNKLRRNIRHNGIHALGTHITAPE